MPQIAEVAVSLAVSKTLHYLIPDRLKEKVALGQRVLVPLRRGQVTGVIVDFPTERAVPELKEIIEVLEPTSVFTPENLRFYRWAAEYYFHPLGEVLKAALPEGVKARIRKFLALSPAGAEYLKSNEGGKDVALLKKIGEKGPLSVTAVLKEVGRGTLNRLVSKRLVSCEERLSEATLRPRKLILYRVKEEEAGLDEKRAPKQAKLLAFLRSWQIASLERLKEEEGSAAAILRPLLRKGMVEKIEEERARPPQPGGKKIFPRPRLTTEQETALSEIRKGIACDRFSPFLLHGITGSGKTEIYLAAISEVLARNKGAIFLLPEIALSSQFYSQVAGRFGSRVAMLHSALGKGERAEEWRLLREGKADIALGPRSAIFAPVRELGLIIVDEEHEGTYKQEEGFRYHARDLALMRGKMARAVVILGSATPSLESFYNSQTKKIRALALTKRIGEIPLPRVEIVDMRQAAGEGKKRPILSAVLLEAMERNLSRGAQTILFLNRRGEATFVLCRECGFAFRCPRCSVSLVAHRAGRVLRCHYCNYSHLPPDECPHCKGVRIAAFGLGTEKLESHVQRLFPGAQVARADSDLAAQKGALETVLAQFEEGRIDILVGTQVIAKGVHFPGLSLVGVVAGDSSLNFPDFRANEVTFQLLTQVSGRAGRASPGQVIVQTYNPDHYAIKWAAEQDYLGFYQEEIKFRKELFYPPFSRLIKLEFKGASEKDTERAAGEFKELAKRCLPTGIGEERVDLLGPAPAPIAKIKGQYRWQIFLKGKRPSLLNAGLKAVLAQANKTLKRGRVRLSIDVDPQTTL